MASVDLVAETSLVVDRALPAAAVADRAHWDRWWPELALTVFSDRGLDGTRWALEDELEGCRQPGDPR
ncbi:MAG: hypothetical protein O2943_00610 [Actinomycetota bacterium]|nr:hypothetical protein [Actinomycetota bacterium]